MEIYRLSGIGETLSHNVRAPDNAKWRVIYFIARRGRATGEQILESVPQATQYTLGELRRKKVIISENSVEV